MGQACAIFAGTDDLSKLVASSYSMSARVDHKPICSRKSSPPRSQKSIKDAAKTLSGLVFSDAKSEATSWNISFAGSRFANSAGSYNVFSSTGDEKRGSGDSFKQEQMQIIQDILISVDKGLLDIDVQQSSLSNVSRKNRLSLHGDENKCIVEKLLAQIDGESSYPQQNRCIYSSGNALNASEGENVNSMPELANAALYSSELLKSKGHIQAERKRREKLNQRFIALSAILPGLKKMDKVSVLGTAIKYVKQLEEQLKLLEDTTVKQIVKSTGCENLNNGHNATSGMDNTFLCTRQQPDIEARAAGKTVLIRVHCDKIRNILLRCLEELERMPLSIMNANVMSFSTTSVDLTITAQVRSLLFTRKSRRLKEQDEQPLYDECRKNSFFNFIDSLGNGTHAYACFCVN
ncbi:hypothetical protein KP509_08G068100 [Ceratopteris richardii]|uniref:BHLH domain-containing protein n=1 Tax=Ceratopteris richardii TaxID=49495 RepID=A0A8T2UAV9_CERRI|nr:hypothetical protein KP509_08G068100 [Ceratopteris richardii]KAH7431818.1 hypothetical protein KP509_08G068100 [Ceratopteris richardii]